MNAVALLLVLVQAILMLQHKSPRIFEQLCVFCLLQLVVGAVFNDALNFGVLLLPITLIGAVALMLMSAVGASEGIESHAFTSQKPRGDEPTRPRWRERLAKHWLFRPVGVLPPRKSEVRFWSPGSTDSLASPSASLRRYVIVTLAPAILMVASVFFYALPRTTSAERLGNRGRALVGFSEKVRLDQFGQMLQNTDTALRIELSDRETGDPYLPSEPIYLRGRVLEKYAADLAVDQPTAEWNAVPMGLISGEQRLPLEYIPSQSSDRSGFDTVKVKIAASSMQERSLFSISPYHSDPGSSSIVHAVDRWTLSRKEKGLVAFPPLTYGFGTNAFFEGKQSSLITRASTLGRMISSTINPVQSALLPSDDASTERTESTQPGDRSERVRSRKYQPSSYLADLTRFDEDTMPAVTQLAHDLMNSIPPNRRTTVEIAKAFERHLSFAGGYRYTLNLDATVPSGIDPIEYFVSTDKSGHCQYFASALAMMLRSVNIPCRLVVGYRTEEYNDLGQYFVARQLHAHAWVEALIDADQLELKRRVFGQAPSSEYWVRLDPTPGDENLSAYASGNVDQVIDMAENLWEKYIVSMDSKRQKESIPAASEESSLASAIQWVPRISRALQSPDWLHWLRRVFSWQAAAGSVILMILVIAAGRLKSLRNIHWRWMSFRKKPRDFGVADRSSIDFYSVALDELEKKGLTRLNHQTPSEFLQVVTKQTQDLPSSLVVDPFRVLTDSFCEARYAGTSSFDDHEIRSALTRLKAAVPSLPEYQLFR
jgi:transglutaminase-like putative cysteine protease